MKKVLYVPLDDRDCNYDFPYQLSLMTDCLSILRPERALMGSLKRAAERERIWDWIFSHAEECSYAILSVDTLLYGNLIGSRIHEEGMESCEERMRRFSELRRRAPGLKIHALHLVARAAAYNSAQEDPDYWADYGYLIWRYGYLLDKLERGEAAEEERAELPLLKGKIPERYLEDFLRRRKLDLSMNLRSICLLRDGVFDTLTIPKDDTAEYGYAASDQKLIQEKLREERLFDRAYIYPGADEAGSVLFARIFNLEVGWTPSVYLRFSSLSAAAMIPKYEDRALGESIRWQLLSAGALTADAASDSDCMLAVHASGVGQLEAMEQEKADLRFRNSMNPLELLRYIEYYKKRYQRAVGLSDVAMANGADNLFMDLMVKMGLQDRISAFAGWNTAENSNGTVIAQLLIAAYYRDFSGMKRQKEVSDCFLGRALTADWLCQANVLRDFVEKCRSEGERVDPYHLGENAAEAREYFLERLRALLMEKLSGMLKGKKLSLRDLRFHWDGAWYFSLDCGLGEEE